ncbi:CotH kinase family protein [Flavobacterium sp. PL02]|uniref:CotH kinase family protein n=1 Tax=Flavobacterium sp. PL02 TaxID=3088354 RepID=UPI002B22856B|nr:CotH kinase family protein [Flavobacterium sp. PL02]MEA9414871.1 CotH kinase family protein [Flavobacterium sp. PL02]
MNRTLHQIFKRFFLLTVLVSISTTAQIKINEVMASNTMSYDPTQYNFSDWIELYNPANTTVSFRNYYFSDDINLPTKWQITSSKASISKVGYLLVYFDETNTSTNASFRLEPKGGTIYMFDASKNLVDKITYPPLNNGNISYGRTTDGGSEWSLMSYPTPKTTNAKGFPASKQAEQPLFSEAGGFISGTKQITLTSKTPGALIYYTLNGDEPFDATTQVTDASKMLTGKALLYNGAISVTNAVIRAKVYAPGYLPSTVVTQSYLLNKRNIDLPVFSVSMNEKYRNDGTLGIWRNYNNKVMKRPSNVEFFPTQNGTSNFNYQMNVEIFAASQRAKEHKQFNIIADKRFQGNNRMKYDFFNEKKGQKRKSVTLRTSGQDGKKTMLQDALVHVLIKDQMDIDRRAYEPAVVYINGNYNGLMNIRERTQKDYLESNYGLETNEYDLLGKHNDYSTIRASQGNMNQWNEMVSYLKANDLKTEANYLKYVEKYIDEPEVLNYFLVQTYINNRDQPDNNIKAWRPYTNKTKWRYILHDADLALIVYSSADNNINRTQKSSTSSMGYVFYSLCKNATFKQKFAGQYIVHAYQTFDPTRTTPITDSLAKKIENEIGYTHDVHSSVPTLATWKKNIQSMKDYWIKRQPYATKHVKSSFGLSGNEMALNVNNDFSKGDVLLNTIKLLNNFKGKYLQSLSYSLEAKPKAGHTFRYWDIKIDNVSSQEFGVTYSGVIPAKATNVVITAVYDNDTVSSETKKNDEDSTVDAKDENAMKSSDVNLSENKVVIEELNKQLVASDVRIYPVPITEDILTITADGNTILAVEFYAINGSLVKRVVPEEMPLDVSFLSKGVYLLRIYTDNGVVVKKIIK